MRGGGGGGAVLREDEMFVKNLSGQMRHCGSLPSHERSHNPDKETRVRREREEANDCEEEEEEEEEVIVSLWPCATNINTWVLVYLCSVAFCRGVGSLLEK